MFTGSFSRSVLRRLLEHDLRPNSRFEDPNLEAIIRAKLNKQVDKLDDNTLSNLDSLSIAEVIPQYPISSLMGIENCKNLIYLVISSQDVSEILPLASLTKLKYLWLDQKCKISDVNPLSELTELEDLNLNINLITDISPLKNLIGLKMLDLHNNDVRDISPLMNLLNLTSLYLSAWNHIGNSVPLKSLTKLSWVAFDMNNVSDVSLCKTY